MEKFQHRASRAHREREKRDKCGGGFPSRTPTRAAQLTTHTTHPHRHVQVENLRCCSLRRHRAHHRHWSVPPPLSLYGDSGSSVIQTRSEKLVFPKTTFSHLPLDVTVRVKRVLVAIVWTNRGPKRVRRRFSLPTLNTSIHVSSLKSPHRRNEQDDWVTARSARNIHTRSLLDVCPSHDPSHPAGTPDKLHKSDDGIPHQDITATKITAAVGSRCYLGPAGVRDIEGSLLESSLSVQPAHPLVSRIHSTKFTPARLLSELGTPTATLPVIHNSTCFSSPSAKSSNISRWSISGEINREYVFDPLCADPYTRLRYQQDFAGVGTVGTELRTHLINPDFTPKGKPFSSGQTG